MHPEKIGCAPLDERANQSGRPGTPQTYTGEQSGGLENPDSPRLSYRPLIDVTVFSV